MAYCDMEFDEGRLLQNDKSSNKPILSKLFGYE